MTRPAVPWLVKVLLAAVAVACALIVLVGSPTNPTAVLAVGLVFAAIAAAL